MFSNAPFKGGNAQFTVMRRGYGKWCAGQMYIFAASGIFTVSLFALTNIFTLGAVSYSLKWGKTLSTLMSSRPGLGAAISKVGLDPDDKKHVGKYSLGMRQRLGLAQAIMEDPDILILDEPMNGLDKDGVKDMQQYLLDLKAQGKTILIASHSAEDIDVLCDTVCEMDKGILPKKELRYYIIV